MLEGLKDLGFQAFQLPSLKPLRLFTQIDS